MSCKETEFNWKKRYEIVFVYSYLCIPTSNKSHLQFYSNLPNDVFAKSFIIDIMYARSRYVQPLFNKFLCICSSFNNYVATISSRFRAINNSFCCFPKGESFGYSFITNKMFYWQTEICL